MPNGGLIPAAALAPVVPKFAPAAILHAAPADPPLGLYVHIPFCVRKCFYCDFNAGPAAEAVRRSYVEALCREITQSPQAGAPARTIFFGGGTPSELDGDQLGAIAAALRRAFEILPGAEWTIECNPGTVSPTSLAGMRGIGFNRISLGVQSFHDHHLKALGRIHDAAEAVEAYRWAGEAGFANRSLDLIFALPEQTLAEWQTDVRRALALDPDHLSLYNLTIEKGTEFGIRFARGELAVPDGDLAADMYEFALDAMAASGYEQYEVSNFARPGKRCAHNQIYWRNEPYLGFGVSAASFWRGSRWTNVAGQRRYAELVAAGQPPVHSQERLPPREAAAEAMMLGLRTADGIRLSEVSARYGVDAEAQFGAAAARFVAPGLLEQRGDLLRLTRRGVLLANLVCAEFLT
jgi:oxygen-independent coproporphyrinogen-3 oxidase